MSPNLVTPGTFSIFVSPIPNHNWNNPDSFSSGQLIATFNRAEGQTVLMGATGFDTFSAAPAFASEIAVNGQNVDFARLTPLGVTETVTISFTPIPGVGTQDFSFVAPFTSVAVAIGINQTRILKYGQRYVEKGAELCLAKIRNTFEMDDIRGVCVTCYMEQHPAVAEFWRMTASQWKAEEQTRRVGMATEILRESK